MRDTNYKTICNKCQNQLNKIYEIVYHDVYECINCGYQKILKIENCCRNPFKIVVIDRTTKKPRLLYQCKNCGGVVNKNKPLSFKKYEEEISDEINTYRIDEWEINCQQDYLMVKDQVLENNFKLSNFGKLAVHYMTEKYRSIRQKALIRDNYNCQIPNCNNIAEEVHHLTYENFPNEKVEDLQSLCSSCHNEITWKERFQRFSARK